MPKTTELVGTAFNDAAAPGVYRRGHLHGLVELVDLAELWDEQRRTVALINRYQADLKRDPGLTCPFRNCRIHKSRKAQ